MIGSNPVAKMNLPVAVEAACARTEVLYRTGLLASALLPGMLSYEAARRLGRLRYRGVWHRNEGRRQSLSLGLQVDREQADGLLDEFFQYWACEDLESILYRLWPAKRLAALINVRGLENLDAALANGQGAILYSGHVHGQYTLLADLGLRGYHPTLVRLGIEATLSPFRRWLFLRKREVLTRKYGCGFIAMYYQKSENHQAPQDGTAGDAGQAKAERSSSGPRARDQIVEALARNEVIVMLIDMPFTRHKVDVEFLGRTCVFPAGPAEIARETGAPLLDFYIHRGTDWVPQIAEIGAPALADPSAVVTLQNCATRLEAQIRQHPAGWAGWHVIEGSRARE